ncbi:GNAT family N-acetyltransferase [Constantimarinum furrinae]|uniref:N-acetyltransferase n=1 Tax=Constantimarinum furrinae TaxID=2562285 RepID=A0A7G8PVP4_9FLAO|nr:GNAT family N-acetyltransferase [Constantimarinum furrinae]QNJ98410.1 N-acetyltransferase [Constantimarinum furrinae]
MDAVLTSERLILRNWKDSDIQPFVDMCCDPEVMRYFPKLSSPQETIDLINRFKDHFDTYGYTYFAVERRDNSQFIGFTGLMNQLWESEFTPCVDMGWRLKRSAWGHGFATEAAETSLNAAFNKFNLNQVYAFAAKGNTASENVMKKLGMEFQGNFVHPKIKDDPRIPYCFAYKKIK